MEPPRIEYKGFKYKYSIKGDICRSLIVRSNRLEKYEDGNTIQLTGNAGFLIKKKIDVKSKFLNGPITRNIKRRKFLTLFKTVF